VAPLIELLLIAGDDDLDAYLDRVIGRPEWHDQAACRGRSEVNFFPYRGESVTAAKALCATCPVTAQCLADALAHEWTIGVWGGTSEIQRKRLRHERRHVAS
jgi:WhiB family redox-sensing transcriptional regulator